MRNAVAVLKDGLQKLNFVLSKQQKKYGIYVLVFSMLGAALETLGVGIIVPFVQVFLNAKTVMLNNNVSKIVQKMHINSEKEFMVIITIMVIIVFLLKNIYFMFLSWIRIKYSSKIERELSVKMLKSCMQEGYMYFVRENDAEIMKYISTDTVGVNQLVYQFLRALTDICIIIFLSIYMFISDWLIAISVVIMACLCLAFVYGYFRNKMRKAGIEYNYYCGKTSQYLLQAVTGIKEVIANNKQRYFTQKYEESLTQRQRKYVQQTIGWEWPAYIIEAFCVMGMLGVLCVRILINTNNVEEMIPTLSAFAIAAFRILPSLGRISTALNSAVYYTPSLNNVYQHLKKDRKNVGCEVKVGETSNNRKISFKEKIDIQNVYWKYADDKPYILEGINLVIPKGTAVGFIGKSGAGKTTLIDIVLGILHPKTGRVLIDGIDVFDQSISWPEVRGYVPQSSFLTSDTIRHNIAFGVCEENINDEKIWRALEQAQLKEFVLNLPDQLNTKISDNGVNFSGGQRQRIAIARALYNDPDILIFDEATAALDNETEKAVMEAINALHGQKTLLIIAHRLTTIKECDVIYEIRDGKIIQRKYSDL